ncbi:TPA: hypothetical protein DEO28_00175 [Candidatus Dependentiae bacterium]|nr:MAG: hypothetical protein UR14_C0001G0107 [candidate division TM6 bacterium GW2011_GWE2_31_21]KKP54013.1 MAG: hypothetical protein UR43_C0001G0031 [candidate division TM6 bacterium GW2011_GWF2_33_332]HBS48406.1 hypothetical protein [Candidatus Dependentiae bacterium]HBZ72920.1 hypothetical protein [Candidatus Dependentiae bacterium]
MFKNFISYSKVLYQLLKTDMIIFKKNIIGNAIDTSIWVTITLVATAYVFPHLGMNQSYGAFMAISLIGSCGVFEVWPTTATLISDITGEQTISYALTLPTPTAIIWIKYAISAAIKSMINALIILPLSKIILGSRLPLDNFVFWKFILIYVSISLFTSFFAVFMTSIVKNMETMRSVWLRTLFPMWFLGSSQFPWYALHTFNIKVAYLMLLNPFTYLMEGIHAATFANQNFLPFWICLLLIWFWIIIFGFVGISRLKKRLDSV